MDKPPIAIAVTWGKDMIKEKGGLLAFVRHFERSMSDEGCLWLQKCKNAPKHDILYVYIIVCNQVRYRLFYAGHDCGAVEIHNGNGHSWSSSQVVYWPRLILAGPVVKAPRWKIPMKGFQGFRYLTEELF